MQPDGDDHTVTNSYLDLRRETSARDRSLRDKVMSLEEAAALILDGDHVALGGCTLSRTPMAMVWALIRGEKKGPHRLTQHHFDRGRSSVWFRREQAHPDELV